MTIDPARKKAIVAALFDRFHMSPDTFSRLTNWQIVELYGHKRNRDGEIEVPGGDLATKEDKPATLESDLMELDKLFCLFANKPGWAPEDRERLEVELRAKYEGK